MNNTSVLHVTGLVKKFFIKRTGPPESRSFLALNNVSFSLYKGETLGLLGPNGAGKTTIIQILLGVLKPTTGAITYFGKNFFTHRSDSLQKVSFASSYVQLPSQLTVRVNLDIYAQLYGLSSQQRAERIEKYLKFFGMWNLADKETGILSAGQMTRVMLAKAFITHPSIVLLDEPTASLDPEIAHSVRSFILEQQKQHGISMLITSHNMDEVTQICNRVIVLKKGKIIANNTPQNLALSVSQVRINILPDNHDLLINFLNKNTFKYSRDDALVTIELYEQDIARFLSQLGQEGISYSQISIDKPSLQDYFLSIARESHP